jgi:hypothetical protein
MRRPGYRSSRPEAPGASGQKSTWTRCRYSLKLAACSQAGLQAVEQAKMDGRWEAAYDSQSAATIPADFQDALPRGKRVLLYSQWCKPVRYPFSDPDSEAPRDTCHENCSVHRDAPAAGEDSLLDLMHHRACTRSPPDFCLQGTGSPASAHASASVRLPAPEALSSRPDPVPGRAAQHAAARAGLGDAAPQRRRRYALPARARLTTVASDGPLLNPSVSRLGQNASRQYIGGPLHASAKIRT